MEKLRYRGHSLWWETLHWTQNLVFVKISFIKSIIVLQVKLAFMQKNHIAFEATCSYYRVWGGTLSTLCTHGITLLIIQSTMKKETTTATTTATLRSEASWNTSTACGWDGVTSHFIFPLSYLIVIKCHKAFTEWLLLFKLCNVLLLNFLQWYSFRCVVNIDLGIDMITQGVWK